MTDPRPAATHRFRLLGWSLVLLMLTMPASIPLVVLTIVGIPLIGLVGIGIPLVLGAVWLTRQLTDVHRMIFTRAVDVRIPRPYRPWPGKVSWTVRSTRDAVSVWEQLTAILREPATWRDLAWLLVNATFGFAVNMTVAVLFGGALWYMSLPLLWAIIEPIAGASTATNVLHTEFGLWAIDSQETAFVGIPIGVLLILLWWWLCPHLVRADARVSHLLLRPTGAASLAARVDELTDSRSETVDAHAAELRRIERDLHDGAQARLVSLGMELGMAEELIRTSPEAAAELLAEARRGTGEALAELRQLVQGVHPPVLADRGLSGAVEALAVAHPLPIETVDHLPGRPPLPVESAAYFATQEVVTNIGKHAEATAAEIRLDHTAGRMRITIRDDGRGGANPASGTGLQGVRQRLATFDGTMNITSPDGGPTVVTMEIPCELSSAKTTPSSEMG